MPRKLLDISSYARDGWEVRPTAPPIGAVVLSTEGSAEVVRVLGKVSDGSRLLELRIVDREGPSFFAATTNVLQEIGSLSPSAPSAPGRPDTPR